MTRILYITQDGITDHIGQAQIAPYLVGLARMGYDIHIVSAEKGGRTELKAQYRALFDSVGIRWTSVRYANKPPLVSSFAVLWLMYRAAKKVAQREAPDIIHCRAYLPLELAVRLKRKFHARLLVDFRDFWADVGLEKKPFKFVYRFLKRREQAYLEAADRIVTLTRRAADILMQWYPRAVGGDSSRYHVIPCCADFGHFDRREVDAAAVERHRQELRLGDGEVLLYLGSVGHDYLLAEMMRLFAVLLRLRPTAKFLFVSNNSADAITDARRAAGIPEDAVHFVSVDRSQVPEYLALADVSVVFIRPTLSKAGCSPTKLAELFAFNIPVVANQGVGDIDAIIDFEKNGSVVVADFEEKTLSDALVRILALPTAERAAIRERSLEFSLEEGVRRYAEIYRLLGAETKPMPRVDASAGVSYPVRV